MIVSQGYIAFFLNWLCSLDKHGITMKSEDLLLFIDRGTAVIFTQLNLPFKYLILEEEWYLDNYIISNTTSGSSGNLPDPFVQLAKLKILIQKDLIELGHDYLYE